jgi:hypothetical protein
MEVKIVKRHIDPQTRVVTFVAVNWPGFDSRLVGDGLPELKDYTNKITNLPDPLIVWNRDEDENSHLTLKSRFVHFSTVKHTGYEVMNAETGEIMEIANLSGCCKAHEKAA